MNDQLKQTGQVSNSHDGCQTNSRRYGSFRTGPVWSAIPSSSWASCFSFAVTLLSTRKVIGFYVHISLHKNLHNRRYHIIVTTQHTMQETKFLLEK